MNHRPVAVRPGPDLDLLLGGGSAVGLGDAALLARAAAGPGPAAGAAFAALVRRHGPLVARVCRGVLGDVQLAEDAEQAVFLVLARRARSIRDPDRLAPWLYGVALRTARAARRQLPHRVPTPIDEATMIDPTPDPARTLIRREQADLLLGAIARLPRRYLTPVVLCDLEGLTHAEAAAQLGCPTATVSSHLKRARAKLRSTLARHRLDFESALPPAVAAATLPRAIRATASAQLLANRLLATAPTAWWKAVAVAALVAGVGAVAASGPDPGPRPTPAGLAPIAGSAPRQDPPPAPESPPVVPDLPPPVAVPPADTPGPRVGFPIVRDVRDYELFVGRVAASRTAEVFPRGSGVVVGVEVAEGDAVRAGQALFKIVAEYNHEKLDDANGNLSRASQRLEQAQRAARDPHDPAVARLLEQIKDLEERRDRLVTGTPIAPFAGQVSRLAVAVGASLDGPRAPLATIAVVDPVVVDFRVPEGEYLKIQRWLRSQPGTTHLPVRVAMVDEDRFAHGGRVLFRATQFTPEPDARPACTLRAELPNPDHALIPGLSTRVRVEYGTPRRALLIPQWSFNPPNEPMKSAGVEVKTVDARDVIGSRQIEIDASRDYDGFCEVKAGLDPETRIILRNPELYRAGDSLAGRGEAPPK